MAKLDAKARKALPAGQFGLPGKKKYPMPDRAHAANAKARASQQKAAGNLSSDDMSAINAKADRILGKGNGKANPTDTPVSGASRLKDSKKLDNMPMGG